jgi:hypothetical protein
LKHDPPVEIPDEDVRSDLFFEDKPEEVDDMFNYQKALTYGVWDDYFKFTGCY